MYLIKVEEYDVWFFISGGSMDFAQKFRRLSRLSSKKIIQEA